MLAHPLKTLASDATKHPKILRHIRTLIIDCGCYLDCEHHVLVLQIANLFLDHLLDMTGLRKLELRITPIVNSDIMVVLLLSLASSKRVFPDPDVLQRKLVLQEISNIFQSMHIGTCYLESGENSPLTRSASCTS